MDIFNNREIAVGIWLAVGIVLATFKKSIRKTFYGVLKAFFRGPILISLGLMIGYVVLIVFILHKIGLWNSGLLKNTIFWSLFVPIVSIFRILPEDGNSFWNAVKDNFRITATLEFVIAFYTFSLWAELLIVPVTTAMIMMQVVAETKEDYKSVEKLLNSLLSLFGIYLLTYATYRLAADFANFAQLETLTDFSLPILLSFLFLPFLFVFTLYMRYEIAFVRLGFRIKDTELRRYAKRAAVFGFHVRTDLLKRWIRNVQFKIPASRSEIKTSIRRVKDLAARERNPIIVLPEQGWSPYRADKFLVDEGLVTSDYYQTVFDDGWWHADSQNLKVGDDILPDYISYCIEGDEHIARRLKLKIDFFDTNTATMADETRQRFLEIGSQLFQKALNQEMPHELRKNIMAETPHSQMIEGKSVRFTREQWPSTSAYSLLLIIEKSIS